MLQPRRTIFVTQLDSNIRRRHEHVRVGKRVIGFVVQIEVFLDNCWQSVVRYDTAHGFAHRDVRSKSGRVDKTPLFLSTYNEALDFAEADLRSRWKNYVNQFLSGGDEE